MLLYENLSLKIYENYTLNAKIIQVLRPKTVKILWFSGIMLKKEPYVLLFLCLIICLWRENRHKSNLIAVKILVKYKEEHTHAKNRRKYLQT